MNTYRSLAPIEWSVVLLITGAVIGWQLTGGSSFTARLVSVLVFGGVAFGLTIRVFRWYREQ
jgi:hypothetical protein